MAYTESVLNKDDLIRIILDMQDNQNPGLIWDNLC